MTLCSLTSSEDPTPTAAQPEKRRKTGRKKRAAEGVEMEVGGLFSIKKD